LTSSTRGIVPVVQIEDALLGDGRPGPLTRRLMGAFEGFVAREARPARGS
jgi:branched-subunit amino acid aminotransferase/4-amino-4-deoxychorismate lyase